jgi:hypothetical protein
MAVTWRDIFQLCLFIIYTVVISRIGYVRGVEEVDFDKKHAMKMYHHCIKMIKD